MDHDNLAASAAGGPVHVDEDLDSGFSGVKLFLYRKAHSVEAPAREIREDGQDVRIPDQG